MGDFELLEKFKNSIGSRVNVESILVDDVVDIMAIDGQNLVEIPKEIGYFSNLRVLQLKNNSLVSLPQTIGHLFSLERLILNNNQIIELPTSIGKLTNLKELHLNNNKLTHLPNEFTGLVNLHTLNLSMNNLITFPSELIKLKTLVKLNLSENSITLLPENIEGMSSIQNLNLNSNKLTDLPYSLSKMFSLQIIHLRLNNLKSPPTMFEGLQELIDIDLTGNDKLFAISNHYRGKFDVVKLRNHLKKISKTDETHKCLKCGRIQSVGLILCEECHRKFDYCFVCKQGFSSTKKIKCFNCNENFHPDHLGSVYKLTSKCPNCKKRMD